MIPSHSETHLGASQPVGTVRSYYFNDMPLMRCPPTELPSPVREQVADADLSWQLTNAAINLSRNSRVITVTVFLASKAELNVSFLTVI